MSDLLRIVPPPAPVSDRSDGDAERLWRHISFRIFELHTVFAERPVTDDGRCGVCHILEKCDGLDDAIAKVDVAFASAYLGAYCLGRQERGASAADLSKSWCSILAQWAPWLTNELAVLKRAAALKLPGAAACLEALSASREHRAGAA